MDHWAQVPVDHSDQVQLIHFSQNTTGENTE